MSDLIERQAAIDAVEHITSSMSVCVNTDECHGMKRMQRQAVIELANLPFAQPEPSQVARDIADIIENEKDMRVIARSEITDEQAILYLQASGWMQRHDKEMYESGLRARLTDDSDSYDALLESAQPEREKGEWEEIEVIPEAYDIAGVKTWASKMRCSQCGFTTFAIEGRFAQYNFCPNCGVDTRGKQDE